MMKVKEMFIFEWLPGYFKKHSGQSAWAIEYTDCIFEEE